VPSENEPTRSEWSPLTQFAFWCLVFSSAFALTFILLGGVLWVALIPPLALGALTAGVRAEHSRRGVRPPVIRWSELAAPPVTTLCLAVGGVLFGIFLGILVE
jgi:hypothetical protein